MQSHRFPDLLPALPPSADPAFQLEQARINYHRHDGTECGVCGQRTQLYRRTISAAMAAWGVKLVWLARVPGSVMPGLDLGYGEGIGSFQWVSIDAIPTRGGDYAKLALWGLIEKRDPEDGRNSGYFKPTPAGVDFFLGKSPAPRHAFIYNQKVIALSEEQITIHEALGVKFDYDALMRGEWE